MIPDLERQLAKEVTQIVHDILVNHGTVYLPGLGTLHVVHEPSTMETQPDGTVHMLPPRDVVRLIPESQDPPQTSKA